IAAAASASPTAAFSSLAPGGSRRVSPPNSRWSFPRAPALAALLLLGVAIGIAAHTLWTRNQPTRPTAIPSQNSIALLTVPTSQPAAHRIQLVPPELASTNFFDFTTAPPATSLSFGTDRPWHDPAVDYLLDAESTLASDFSIA